MPAPAFAWDPRDYAVHSAAQVAWARELVSRLGWRGHEHVLDVGCGDGRVDAEMALAVPRGRVLGIDSSSAMVDHATQAHGRGLHDNLAFCCMDATAIRVDASFDVVLSNAALHWVADQPAFLRGAAHALRPGGRLVVSCGGRGNAAQMVEVAQGTITEEPWRRWFTDFVFPWSFHDALAYQRWVEEAGLGPVRVALVHKDMPHAGEAGLAGWLRTTWMPYTHRVPEADRARFVDELARRFVAAHGADAHGLVHVDMVRLEGEAVKGPS